MNDLFNTDIWLEVAVELKRAANGSTATQVNKTDGGGVVIKTERAVIRLVVQDGLVEIRSADFHNGRLWQASENGSIQIIDELSDGERAELSRNFGIGF